MVDDYQRITEIIQFLRNSTLEQPAFDEIARQVGLSPAQFQRLFHHFAGVSPKRFLQQLSGDQLKKRLQQSIAILDTNFAAGLSNPGYLHDLSINITAVTPEEYKPGRKNLRIRHAIHQTPFGKCFIAITEQGICQLEFIDSNHGAKTSFMRLQKAWLNANITEEQIETGEMIQHIFSPLKRSSNKPLRLLLQGTNFQLQVWQALLKIPAGCIASYGYLAKAIGKPTASRAVGTAISNNPISYLIPCHRVLRGNGEIGGYRWGIERKLVILGKELCKTEGS